jgi:sterol desaturase/sphingolipid hydroxylase (fatty acid hydroxylase superfamily)
METILNTLIPVSFLLLVVLERIFPGRPLPKVRFWYLKGFVFFVLTGAIMSIVPEALARALAGLSPVRIEGTIGMVPAAIVGALLADLLSYVVHRTMHNVPLLWRWSHQLHHSAERVDVLGSAYFSPLDIVIFAAPSVLAAVGLNLSPDAAALAGFAGFVTGTFQHLNIRTPQWLGYFIQRPEAHSVHHARGVHAYNYGGFPIWDILLGTFRNPVAFAGPSGFWDGASSKLGAMLMGRDVAQPPLPISTVQQAPAPAE